MNMLACFDIAVTFDAIVAVGTAYGPRHPYVHIVSTSQRETHAQPISPCSNRGS